MGVKAMTNNEIIKALDCLKGDEIKCRECPYLVRFDFPHCKEKVAKDALGLIKRQKAKIEALQMDNAQLHSDCINANMNLEHLQADIERLKGWQDLLKAEKHSLIKAEAIKEFAEKIKERMKDLARVDFDGEFYYLISEPFVDNLVKKMVGEDNG